MRKKNYFLEGDAAAAASGFEGFLTAIKGFGDSLFEGMGKLWDTIKNLIIKAIKFLFTGETTTTANPEYGMFTGFTNIFRSKGNEISANITTTTPGFFMKEIGNIGNYAVTTLHLVAAAAILGIFLWGAYKLCSWLYKKYKKSEGYSVNVPSINTMLSEASIGKFFSLKFIKKMIGLGAKSGKNLSKVPGHQVIIESKPQFKALASLGTWYSSNLAPAVSAFLHPFETAAQLKKVSGEKSRAIKLLKDKFKQVGTTFTPQSGVVTGKADPDPMSGVISRKLSARKHDELLGIRPKIKKRPLPKLGRRRAAALRDMNDALNPVVMGAENSMLMDILSSAALQEAKMFSKKLRKTTNYSVADRNALAEAYYQESLANKLSYFLG